MPGPICFDKSRDPVLYTEYFQSKNVTTMIALNEPEYDEERFKMCGVAVFKIIIKPGQVPDKRQLCKFFSIVECSDGAVAVHSKAGLGRAGTMIAAYLIKHYRFTTREAIAWVRITRPGSVIGEQQKWLGCSEKEFIRQGNAFRQEKYGDCDKILCHSYGIYNYPYKSKDDI